MRVEKLELYGARDDGEELCGWLVVLMARFRDDVSRRW